MRLITNRTTVLFMVAATMLCCVANGLAQQPTSAAAARESVVSRFAQSDAAGEVPDFQQHVVPLLGKLGCNVRACHGSFQGRGGFRLSLFGYDFESDHGEIYGRVDPEVPADSVMLQKPLMQVQHEGGQRLKAGSWEHHLLLRWIEGGSAGQIADISQGGLVLALRLVESGVRFITVSNGGWDTHRDNWNVLKTRQLPALDDALFGLFTGLAARGLLDSTIVYVTGEFGRTPKINSERVGRDHYHRNMFMLLGGGGVKGGQVLGESDETASMPKGDGFSPDDVAAVFFHALGIDHEQEYHTTTGRRVMIVRDGHVIPELIT